ncbi:MAG: hypothetical protein ABJM26_12525 [Anderseniella sp.]
MIRLPESPVDDARRTRTRFFNFGPIGLFALNNGRLADGREVLPSGWMKRSTGPSKGNIEYGSLWWLHGNGNFRAQGIFGQDIFIDPIRRIVIALQSARADADKADDWNLQDAFYEALIQALDK